MYRNNIVWLAAATLILQITACNKSRFGTRSSGAAPGVIEEEQQSQDQESEGNRSKPEVNIEVESESEATIVNEEPEQAEQPVEGYSQKANMRFRGGDLIVANLSQALEIPEEQICNELGQLSCNDVVHKVTLGGTDAYASSLYEPVPDTGVSTSLAVDRVVLSACTQRAEQDLSGASQVLFSSIKQVTDASDPKLASTVTALYQRGLQRNPKPFEIDALTGMYNDLKAAGSASLASDWSKLSCYAVFTSVEALFY